MAVPREAADLVSTSTLAVEVSHDALYCRCLPGQEKAKNRSRLRLASRNVNSQWGHPRQDVLDNGGHPGVDRWDCI